VLVREKVAGPQVTGRLLAGNAGYVRIASFRTGVDQEIRKQVATLTKAGAVSLILDVRRVAEGSIDNGIAAARLFVKSGTLATRSGRDPKVGGDVIAAKAGDGEITLPALVLVSNGTSGPAEVFAAALDGNTRADLVGERTLGRAGVQKLVTLPEGRGLWLTYAKYLTPAARRSRAKG